MSYASTLPPSLPPHLPPSLHPSIPPSTPSPPSSHVRAQEARRVRAEASAKRQTLPRPPSSRTTQNRHLLHANALTTPPSPPVASPPLRPRSLQLLHSNQHRAHHAISYARERAQEAERAKRASKRAAKELCSPRATPPRQPTHLSPSTHRFSTSSPLLVSRSCQNLSAVSSSHESSPRCRLPSSHRDTSTSSPRLCPPSYNHLSPSSPHPIPPSEHHLTSPSDHQDHIPPPFNLIARTKPASPKGRARPTRPPLALKRECSEGRRERRGIKVRGASDGREVKPRGKELLHLDSRRAFPKRRGRAHSTPPSAREPDRTVSSSPGGGVPTARDPLLLTSSLRLLARVANTEEDRALQEVQILAGKAKTRDNRPYKLPLSLSQQDTHSCAHKSCNEPSHADRKADDKSKRGLMQSGKKSMNTSGVRTDRPHWSQITDEIAVLQADANGTRQRLHHALELLERRHSLLQASRAKEHAALGKQTDLLSFLRALSSEASHAEREEALHPQLLDELRVTLRSLPAVRSERTRLARVSDDQILQLALARQEASSLYQRLLSVQQRTRQLASKIRGGQRRGGGWEELLGESEHGLLHPTSALSTTQRDLEELLLQRLHPELAARLPLLTRNEQEAPSLMCQEDCVEGEAARLLSRLEQGLKQGILSLLEQAASRDHAPTGEPSSFRWRHLIRLQRFWKFKLRRRELTRRAQAAMTLQSKWQLSARRRRLLIRQHQAALTLQRSIIAQLARLRQAEKKLAHSRCGSPEGAAKDAGPGFALMFLTQQRLRESQKATYIDLQGVG